jgi:mono/diheme cytochrome c family protein
MRRLVRFLTRALAVVAALAVILAVVVQVRAGRTFDAPYPEIAASKDPNVIARGRYIAYGPAHCVNCHTPGSQTEAVKNGATPPLIGGRMFKGPFGTLYSRNLTPDRETGIGRYTDRELARVLRHGVLPDGRAVLPFMEMQNLSEEDLVAVISFLRAQPAVRNVVPERDFNFIGKAILAFAIKPIGPSRPVPAKTPAPGSLESGEYLATSVANCASCHTERNLMTGAYMKPRFAGGMTFPLDEERIIVTPNLTPARVGRITTWSEEQFVGRFGVGMGIPGTHMPWRQYQTMSETDVRSIYRYLRTLDPVELDPGPSLQTKKAHKEKKEKEEKARKA